jgi:hypothetical protein
MNRDGKYTWNCGSSELWNHDDFDTREQALADGRAEYPGEEIRTGLLKTYQPWAGSMGVGSSNNCPCEPTTM